MSGDNWKPALYERFQEQRSQPFRDVLAMVERRDGMRVVDLGCGTGGFTRDLHAQLRARETIGIDSSAAIQCGRVPVDAESGTRLIRGPAPEGPYR
jgi:trans-aconitate methyltransferase